MNKFDFAVLGVLLLSLNFFCGCNMHSQREGVMAQLQKSIKEGAQEIILEVGDQKIELVKIPAGSFLLDSEVDEQGLEPNNEPVRQITISNPFYIGRYEITQAQYFAVMGHEPLSYLEYNDLTFGQKYLAETTGLPPEDSDYFPIKYKGDNLPVDQANYRVAKKFCLEISEQLGISITLPTTDQWEYACRAGTSTRFYTGDTEDDLARAGWFRENSNDRVHPVGQKEPNAFGLYDMHGNVNEHCIEGQIMGGCYFNYADNCQSDTKKRPAPIWFSDGIRIVINPNAIDECNRINYVDKEQKIEIVDYGLYCIGSEDFIGKDMEPDTLMGYTKSINPFKDLSSKEQTTIIEGKIGTHFGITILSTSEDGSTISSRVRVMHPKMTNPKTGENTTIDEWDWEISVGISRFVGWNFEEDWEIVTGKWTIQVLLDGEVSVQKEFTIVEPEGAM